MNVQTNDDLRCTIALAALERVIDPEIGLNVVDLGLIYQVMFDDSKGGATVSMTLTTPHCPMGESITGGVRRALNATFSGTETEVALTFDPPWNYDRISEAGKQFLSR